MHGKSVTKVMEKSLNVMEFGFENCVGTLILVVFILLLFFMLEDLWRQVIAF